MLTRYKRFKDPIYGYIKIEESIVKNVIDMPEFQRLRDVIQTSYVPLYSSALHNRFAHSLGVYHLGKIASHALEQSFVRNESLQEGQKKLKDYIQIFELACLLHDVGHAPFSHTGEKFYLQSDSRRELHEELFSLVKDRKILKEEISKNSYNAAPHELMSAILALNVFKKEIPAQQRSFFARCITGYKYTEQMNEDKSLKNCFIELLNSKVIDVDKLDYLMRDSYMSGFDTVRIDYFRLLDSICVDKNENGYYEMFFHKAAVSILENVVYAHDAERKWLQNHPVVLYEANLIEKSMEAIIKTILHDKKFNSILLSQEGLEVDGFGRIRLMGDSDILYLMKNLEDQSVSEEYYNRNKRKHPIWKTEEEFQAIFTGKQKELEIIENLFVKLRDFLRSTGLPFVINEEALNIARSERDKLQNEKEELKKAGEQEYASEIRRIDLSLKDNQNILELISIFDKFRKEQKINFDFLVIYTKQFISGFRKQEFGNIELRFPELKNPCRFGDISNVLKGSESKAEKFFFLYCTQKENKNGQKTIEIMSLIDKMLSLATRLDTASRLR